MSRIDFNFSSVLDHEFKKCRNLSFICCKNNTISFDTGTDIVKKMLELPRT